MEKVRVEKFVPSGRYNRTCNGCLKDVKLGQEALVVRRYLGQQTFHEECFFNVFHPPVEQIKQKLWKTKN